MFGKFLSEKSGNNALSFDKRKKLGSKLKLFIPTVKSIGEITEEKLNNFLNIGAEIVFEEVENNKLISKFGLKYYLEGTWNNIPIYIFDNHNVALYFLGKYFFENKEKLDLIHIDQHSDLRNPEFIPNKIKNLEELMEYTFKHTNVGNYLIPAQKLGFIGEIIQVRSEYKLLNFKQEDFIEKIVNIDIDFWAPEMGTSTESLYHLKNLMKNARLILIASSPYFIEQNLAINLIKKLLK